jgi:Protein of unknown function (DUF2934)
MHKHHDKRATTTRFGSNGQTRAKQTAVTSGDTGHNGKMVSMEDIRLCAYWKWLSAGAPAGDGIQFWLESEKQLAKGH